MPGFKNSEPNILKVFLPWLKTSGISFTTIYSFSVSSKNTSAKSKSCLAYLRGIMFMNTPNII